MEDIPDQVPNTTDNSNGSETTNNNNKRPFSEISSSSTETTTTENNNDQKQQQEPEMIPESSTPSSDEPSSKKPKLEQDQEKTTKTFQNNKNNKKEQENDSDDDDDENDENGESSSTKTPKRKVALIIGYDGSLYSGLQINPSVTTIEEILLEALVSAGAVARENAELKKIAWNRASRTDKGVSAVLNVVCLRMILAENIVEKINGELERITSEKGLSPIHVYRYLRVTSSFDPKSSCSGRKYQYVIPTFAFEALTELREAQKKVVMVNVSENSENGENVVEQKSENGENSGENEEKAEKQEEKTTAQPQQQQQQKHVKLEDQMSAIDMQELFDSRSFIENYRISEQRLQYVRSLFQHYIGTKCYHNFTQRSKTNPNATMRYITKFTVSDPFVVSDKQKNDGDDNEQNDEKVNGVEHVILTVEGQSFILNQIRKMVGFAVAVARGHIAESDFAVAMDKKKAYYVPMVPGYGLLLDELYFDYYNEKHGDVHGKFDWNEEELKQKIASFKQIVIHNIGRREREYQTMARWLYVLPRTLQTDLLQPGLVREKPTLQHGQNFIKRGKNNKWNNNKGKKKKGQKNRNAEQEEQQQQGATTTTTTNSSSCNESSSTSAVPAGEAVTVTTATAPSVDE